MEQTIKQFLPSPDGVKTAATMYTAERVQSARENIAKYQWAKEECAEAVEAADKLTAVPVDEFLKLMPSPNMIRDMSGDKQDAICPLCGKLAGRYQPVDIVTQPWVAICRHCEKPPSPHIKEYFLSGLDERGWFHHEDADTGLLPEDEKTREAVMKAMGNYTYVYWARLSVELLNASMAYVYTGDPQYGRYVAKVMVRFSDYYPYFRKQDTRGDTHTGAMIQDGAEAMFMARLARSYDACFTFFDDPEVLKWLAEFRETHGLAPLTDAASIKQYFEGRIYGLIASERAEAMPYIGYGRRENVIRRIAYINAHRGFMAPETIAAALGDSPLRDEYREEAEKFAFKGFQPDGSNVEGGLAYDMGAFVNLMDHYREVQRLTGTGREQWWEKRGVIPAYHLYFDLFCIGRFYPHYGDTPNIGMPGAIFRTGWVFSEEERREFNRQRAIDYVIAFDVTGEERFARIAWKLNGEKLDGLHLTIFDKDAEAVQSKIREIVAKADEPVERSIIAKDLGFAVLKSGEGENRRALWLRSNKTWQKGTHGWHGHADSLTIGLFGYGLNLMPDTSKYECKAWPFGKNTVSLQETSVPEATRDQDKLPRPILAYMAFIHKFPGVQVARAWSKSDKQSHRTVFLVDVGPEAFYVVDSLRVSGSEPEEYATVSFHANQGTTSTGLTLKESEDKIVGTSRWQGHWEPPLFDAVGENIYPWWAEIALDDTFNVLEGQPCDVKLRFTALHPTDRVFHTHYAPPPIDPRIPTQLAYFFQSAKKPVDGGHRLFAAVIEPYRTDRVIRSAKVAGETRRSQIIEVVETSGRKLTFVVSDGVEDVAIPGNRVFKGAVAVMVEAPGQEEKEYFMGSYLRGKDEEAEGGSD